MLALCRADSLPNPLPQNGTHQYFIPGSGNGGVVANIENTDGAIGYVQTANALTAVNGSNINFAQIAGRDPVKNLPATAGQIVLKQLLTSEVSARMWPTGAPRLRRLHQGTVAS